MAGFKRRRRRRKPRQNGRPTKYKPEFCAIALQLGEKGYGITDAAHHFGVVVSTYLAWERRFQDFKKAARRIRENSKFWARWRSAYKIDRLAEKEESHLIEALYRVRAERMVQLGTIEDLRKELGIERVEIIPNAKRVKITTRALDFQE